MGAVEAQIIDHERGRDQSVDYGTLTRFGPWDDRNYKLTAGDLALLSPDEHEQRIAVPAFFRVELRRRNPQMRRTGPGQYPRSSTRRFFNLYGGYLVDGRFHLGARREGSEFLVDLDRPRSPLAAPDGDPLVTTDVRVTSPNGAETSAVAIHPTSSDLVIAGSNGPLAGQQMHYSSDGGETWFQAAALPLGSTCCNPSVGFSSDGSKAYATTVSNGLGASGVWFYRSGDNGQTWSDLGADPRRELGGVGFDREYLHVDTHAGSPYLDRLYLAWHENNVMKVGHSPSLGSTWSTPISVSSGDDQLGSGGDVTTDATGVVYYFWAAFNSGKIWLAQSHDGGAMFAPASEVTSTLGSFSFPIPSQETHEAFIYVTAGADLSSGPYAGSVYAAWTRCSETAVRKTYFGHCETCLST